MKNLPEEVISEILLRLPVKSLLRFRSVSKSWLSLISNPQFTKSHFELSSVHTTNRLIYVSASEARSIDFNASFHDKSAHVNLNFPLTASPYYVQIMGSCRGLLLLTLDNNDDNLFVWNPLTGVPKRLSYSLISSNRSVFSTFYGFGYDESTDDYLVVLAWYNPRAAIQVTQVEFLSLRTNSWKTIEGSNFPHANMMNGPWAGSLLNGAIHWLIFHEDGFAVIVAFDLAEKKLQEVPMANDVEDDECCDLGVLAGCLSLCNWGIEPIEIWIMKEYGVKSSWSKSIILCTDKFPTSYFTPICFTNGAEIVGIDGYTSLLKCNYSGELLEHFVYSQYRYGCKAAIYAESLLSFPNDHGEIQANIRDQSLKYSPIFSFPCVSSFFVGGLLFLCCPSNRVLGHYKSCYCRCAHLM